MTGPPSTAGPEGPLHEHLRRLAGHAPAARGAVTADRAVALSRAHRRRWGAWTATVLAIGGVVTAFPGTVAGLSPGPGAVGTGSAAGTPAAEDGWSLYDVPTRGALAGDEEFLAGVRALPWTGSAGPPGAGASGHRLEPAEDTRRVLYAADVPGGSRWALVMGRVGRQLVHAWFTGPAGAAAGELTLPGEPVRTSDGRPITLLDAGAGTGPLVVVGRPGQGAEYSPSLDRDASGRLGRSYVELPVVDGVPVGEVAAPVAYGSAQVRLPAYRPDGTGGGLLVPTTLQDYPFPRPAAGREGLDFWVRLEDCLTPLGFEVQVDPTGSGLGWSGGPALAPDVGPLSSAEQAENDAALDQCLLQAGGP